MTNAPTDPKPAWAGPASLSYGFRPFFLGASLLAVLTMTLWIPMLSGYAILPTAFDPVAWHAHEFLFGYLGAVIAGFLLTAVPNWTKRPPIIGGTLAALAVIWLAGRLAVAASALLDPMLVAMTDLALPLGLAALISRDIVAGKNWRNLLLLALLALFATGNGLFHWEATRGAAAAQGMGLRMGLGAGIAMIAVVGGRIIPIFTRNWLVTHKGGPLPALPMQAYDKIALLVLGVSLALWILMPAAVITGFALVLSGALHSVRLARWVGYRCLTEPLVAILHLGYAFLPAGALLMGLAILEPGLIGVAAAQHLWMGGAIGVMTLGVMTRATLGHTGQALTASRATALMYSALITAVLTRVVAGSWNTHTELLYGVSGVLWIAAFGGFILGYGKFLVMPKILPSGIAE